MGWTKQQEQAISSENNRILVSASAGSGKTAAMVQRAVKLVTEKRVSVTRILMLTFTEAAAAEMKERLAKEFIKKAKLAHVEDLDFLREQLDSLQAAQIGTIHGFCRNIIRNNFEKAGLAPSFTIADTETASALSQRAVAEVIRKRYDSADDCFLRLTDIMSVKRGDGGLIDTIIKMYEYSTVQEDRQGWLEAVKAEASLPDLEQCVAAKEYVCALRNSAKRLLEKLYALAVRADNLQATQYINVIRFRIDALQNFDNVITVKDICLSAERAQGRPPSICQKSKTEFPQLDKEYQGLYCEIKAFNTDIADLKECGSYEEMVSGYRTAAEYVLQLVALTEEYSEQFSRVKEENKVLDFADLEKFALKILEDKETCDIVKGSYDYVFIDEYQDTNTVQERLLSLISDGRMLFMVGDSKQCIYRFRLSDPAIFIAKQKKYAQFGGGESIFFNNNFRSSPAILDFINRVFNVIMTEEFGGVDYGKEAMLISGDNADRVGGEKVQDATPDVAGLIYTDDVLPPKEDKKANVVYSVKDSCNEKKRNYAAIYEGRWIAAEIKKLIGTELYDSKRGQTFTASYKDIAVLFSRRNSKAKAILEVLEQEKIPVAMGSFAASDYSPDVEILTDYIRLIDNRNDDYALISILRSPIGGLTNDELASIRLSSGDRDARFYQCAQTCAEQGTACAEKVRKFYEELNRFTFEADFYPLNELMQRIINNKYRQYLSRAANGKERLALLENFINSVRGKSYAASVTEFLNYHDEFYCGEKVSESVGEDNVVSVMTIHGSKGLEFPIVFVANLDSDLCRADTSQVMVDKDYGVAIYNYNIEDRTKKKSFAVNALKYKRKYEQKEDALRVFYVALTRARNKLFLSGKAGKETVRNPDIPERATKYAEWLCYAAIKDSRVMEQISWNDYIDVSEDKEMAEYNRVTAPPEADSAAADNMCRVWQYKYPHNIAVQTGIKYSVTSINKMETEVEMPTLTLFGETKAERGTEYHTVLENIDYRADTLEKVQNEMQRMAENGIIAAERLKEVKAADILKCLHSPVMRYAAGRKALREQRFMLQISAREAAVADTDDKILIQGAIDLLILGEENIVVDFKASMSDENTLIDRYKGQLRLYALAAERTLGIKVHKKILYVFGKNKELIID